jgi:hypothetical protein
MSHGGYVTAVSGVPRSCTSRRPDAHYPHGYFEYEPVRRLASSTCVSFMDRDLAEAFASRRDMLIGRGDATVGQPEQPVVRARRETVRAVREWLALRRSCARTGEAGALNL